MQAIDEIEERRRTIIKEMGSIRSLRRGTINEQYLKVRRVGQKDPVLQGPYYVLSRSEGSKTVSQRLQPGAELEQARKDVAEHKRFVALCREFEELTEKLGVMEREEGRLSPEKKRRNLPSKKTRK